MKKTKVLRLNAKNQKPIVLGEEIIDDVDTFVYLGAIFTSKVGTEQEIEVRLGMARAAFNKLNKSGRILS